MSDVAPLRPPSPVVMLSGSRFMAGCTLVACAILLVGRVASIPIWLLVSEVLVTIFNEQAYTLQLGLQSFQGSHTTEWNLLMAGNVMSMIPMLVIFVAAQRWFVRGIATQGLKG